MGIIIRGTTEAFQGIILFKKKLKVRVEILLQYGCDIKSWLGPFTKPLVLSAYKNSTLRTHISSVRRTIQGMWICVDNQQICL